MVCWGGVGLFVPKSVHNQGLVVLVTQLCPTLCNPIDSTPPDSCPWNSPGKNTGLDCHSLLQRSS